MTHWREKTWKIASLKMHVARPRVDWLLRKVTYKNFGTCGVDRWLLKRSRLPLSILNIGANIAWLVILKWHILVYVFLLIAGIHNLQEWVTPDMESMLTSPSIFALKTLTRPHFAYTRTPDMSFSLCSCTHIHKEITTSRCVCIQKLAKLTFFCLIY